MVTSELPKLVMWVQFPSGALLNSLFFYFLLLNSSMKQMPIIAIIGRPNVGKSTLFNRIVQSRKAIVDKEEGVTRDRKYENVEWNGKLFTLVDTGGYLQNKSGVIDTAIREQVKYALEEASLILLMLDGKEGINPSDEILVRMIRQTGKSVIIVVNKIDSNDMEPLTNEFYRLGFDEIHSLSALMGRKIGDMLDQIADQIGTINNHIEKVENNIRIAIVGCPNVGKSSITNRLLGEKASIVTDIPGTTRDSIDSKMRYNGKNFILVDTAGLRKKTKIKEKIEFYSTIRTRRALDLSDVVIVVTDANEGFRKQDQQIIEEVIVSGKSLVVAVNKWDLINKNNNTLYDTKKMMTYNYPSLKDYPILFVSARTNQRVSSMMSECETVFQAWSKKYPTSRINGIIKNASSQLSPPSIRGKHIRLKYGTQIGFRPPRICVYSNFPHLITASYKNFLENQFRIGLDLFGTPLKLQFKSS